MKPFGLNKWPGSPIIHAADCILAITTSLPTVAQVYFFVFYGYYPLPELLGQKLHLCIISILYLFSFFVFWALSLLSAELHTVKTVKTLNNCAVHSCSKFSTHSKSKSSSSAMGPGQNTIYTNAESSFKIWLRIPKFPRLFGCRTKTV